MLSKHEPDKLDLQCTAVLNVLNLLDETIENKIGLLEQCIDYLRMEQANNESTEQDL